MIDDVLKNSTGDFDSVSVSGDRVIVTVPVERDSDEGSLGVNFDWEYEHGPLLADDVTFSPFTFSAGATNGFVTVSINKSIIFDGISNELYLDINYGDGYAIGHNDVYFIYINEY